MFASAEKTITHTTAAQSTTAGTTFFRKAEEADFFGSKEERPFFQPAIQAKLSVSNPGDPQEEEADEVADKVMRKPEPVAVTEPEREKEDLQLKAEPRQVHSIQRKADSSDEKEEPSDVMETDLPINRKSGGLYNSDVLQQSGRGPPESLVSFIYKLRSSKGSGIPLPGDTRRSMETRFDADLGSIRIHANTTSESLSRYIHAQAFTHGTDIYFNTGKFAPHTDGGGFLLAHEITHVLQQSGRLLTRKQYSYPVKDTNTSSGAAGSKSPATSGVSAFSNAPAEVPARDTKVEKPAVPSETLMPGDDVKPSKKVATTPKEDLTAPPAKDKAMAAGDKAVPVTEIPRAPASPKDDPAFQTAKKQVQTESIRQKKHDPAAQKRIETEKASAIPEKEQSEQDAREKSTADMEKTGAAQKAAGSRFTADQFKKDLLAKISQKQPESESEAKAFAQKPPLEHFEQDFSGKLATEQGKVTGPLEQKANTPPSGGIAEKPVAELPKQVHSPAPKPIDPQLAIPKARTDQEISLQHESDRLDGAMEQNQLSDEQLSESREPEFKKTLKAKNNAKIKIAEAPVIYRQRESGILENAASQSGVSLDTELAGMKKVNHKLGGKVHVGQEKTESHTEKRQREIKEKIDGIYDQTVTAVKDILKGMADKVKEDFANSLKEQTNTFNENVRRRISNYYGDWRIDDKLFGPSDVVVLPDGSTRSMTLEESLGLAKVKRINPHVYRIFVDEKNKFLDAMNTRLDTIANDVEAGLTAAHNRIKLGELEMALFKTTLKGEELIYASQLEVEVQEKFNTLEESINDTREDLLQTMADQYKENVNQLEKTFNEINDELKKSWIDRAIEFIETVGKTIFQLAELLFSILVRVAYLVWDIVKHPIRFFETLVSGLMQGIGSFIENIGTHLQEAFWTWISGATPAKNIRLSGASGIDSLFDLVVQILGLGPAELRAIVEKVLGKEFMEIVDKGTELGEKALEPVTILLTKGPLAFWGYIKDTVSDAIQSSFDRIRESVFNAFVEKALKWVAGFFIPGGGFVKIVHAIVKAFQFVAENLENIRHFFDSVFDSMEAAVQGNTEGVASKIITGLKIGVVMALDFLAKLLGLDKIVDSVQKIIQSLRRPIVNAIEWILKKVKPLAMKLVSLVQKGVDWTKKKVEQAKTAGSEAISAVAGWLGLKKSFKGADNEQHKLYFSGSERNAELMVASENPRTFKSFLASIDTKGEASKTKAKNDAMPIAGSIDRLIKTKLPEGTPEEQRVQARLKNMEVRDLLNKLSPYVAVLMAGQKVPTGKNKAEAIPLTWYKPRSSYPQSITLDDKRRGLLTISFGKQRTLEPDMESLIDRREDADVRLVREKFSEAATITIGVQENNIPVLNSILVKNKSYRAALKTEPQRGFRSLCIVFGRDLRAYNEDADHVKDLQFEGHDDLDNLWPLNADINRSAGRFLEQVITFKDESGNIKAVPLFDASLLGKYFKITSVQLF